MDEVYRYFTVGRFKGTDGRMYYTNKKSGSTAIFLLEEVCYGT